MDTLIPGKGIKVVHLQYGTAPSGNYTLRQHEAFLQAGLDSSVLSLYSTVMGDPKVQSLGKTAHLTSRINQKLQELATKNRDRDYGAFTCSFMGTDISGHPLVKEADYIYVHYVLGGFLSIKSLKQLARLGKPLIMVMHDMWAITGGCSYSFDCDKFNTHCHNCPILAGDKQKDISFRQFEKKKKLYDQFDNLFFVTPSTWLYNLAKNASLTKTKPIFHIPNAIDSTLFKPFDKDTAKKILNIDASHDVVSFGANKITSPYKGWKYLQAALHKLKDKYPEKDLTVLVFGSGPNEELKNAIPFDVKFMGFISDDYTTNLVYNASDVFVAPSLADNLPTTIIESMCCGTPVVGFDIGGIPDIIIHRENGYLAKYKDADDLADGIGYCLANRTKGKLSPKFATDKIIQGHLNLFSAIKKTSAKSES